MDGETKSQSDLNPRNRALHGIQWANLARRKAGDTDADDQTVGFILSRYEAGKARREQWEANAAMQLRWTAGDQMVLWNRQTEQFTLVDMPNIPLEHRHPLQVNHLKSVVEHKIAMVLSQPISWAVRPFTNEDDDVSAAEIGQKLLHYQFRAGSRAPADQITRALWMMFCTGIVFPFAVWDPWLDPISEDDDDDDDDDDEKRSTKKRDYRGLPDIRWATGFEITEPYGCKSIHHAPWIIDSEWVTVESLRARYPLADELEADPNYNPPEWHDSLDMLTRSDESGTSDPDDMILKHSLWRPDSVECPGGFYAVVAGEKVLHRSKNPYKHGCIPASELRELPTERFRPECTISNLMTMQGARNRLLSSKNAAICLSIAPRIIKEAGVQLTQEHLTEGLPTIIEVQPGQIDKVKPMPTGTIPADAHHFDEELRRDIQDVSGVHDSTMGRRENSNQSGKHALAMQSQDARMTTATRRLIEFGFGYLGQLILHLWYQFVPSERMLPITGEGQYDEVLIFKGEKLYPKVKGRPAYPSGPFVWNIVAALSVEPDSGLILEKIKLLTELQYLNPANPQHQALILKWLGEQAVFTEDLGEEHRAKAKSENELLLAGHTDKVFVSMGDHDDSHILELLSFTARDRRYREAALKELAADARGEPVAPDKSVITRFRQHYREHLFNKAERELRPMLVAKQLEAMGIKELGETMAPPPGAESAAATGIPDAGGAPGGPPPGGLPAMPMGVPGGDPMAQVNGQGGAPPWMNGMGR